MRGCFRKIKEMAGICQNRLSALVLHINFDVEFDTECVKNIFGMKHRVFAFTTNCASATLNLNLFYHKFDNTDARNNNE